MKIGVLVSTCYSVGNVGSGILAQARAQSVALRDLGCEVIELNPWDVQNLNSFDVIHFHQGGLNFHTIEACKARLKNGILVFAPAIDSNQPNYRYKIAAQIGSVFSQIHTIPGAYKVQCEQSDLVICRSLHEKYRINKGLGIDLSKIELVLNGTEVPPPQPEASSKLLTKYGLPQEFLLHVGVYSDLRKNVIKLAQSASELQLPLIIAGNAMPGEVLTKLKDIASNNTNIHLMGYVDKELLEAMYASCKVFCLPSLHEGTGLVALEAAIRGANIVITKNGGPPDYFAHMAEYVDPNSINSIKNALLNAWNKPQTNELIHHITNKLKWSHSAEGLLRSYKKHLSSKGL